MSFFDWLKRKVLGALAPTRDVSRLGGSDVDAVDERVDLAGGPLKEGHRRRALRDRRLLPRTKPVFGRRKRVMTASEAGRLFADTLRTRNRSIRDLLPDEDQLARYELPCWRSEDDLAKALGIPVGELRFFSIHREKERAPHYVTFAIRKRSGGSRLIMAPKRRLKAIQRRLLRLLVDRLPVSEHAHGFLAGRSVRTGAAPHVGHRVVVRMDLRDFFPSVHFGRVRGLLVALGYGYPVATVLAVLMTEAERQPVEVDGTVYHVPVGRRHCIQGAPTSPGLCNAVMLRADRRLAGLARAKGFVYTRYADDLAFSGEDVDAAHKLRVAAEHVLREEGFEVRRDKTRVMRRGSRQRVTGVVVNEVLGLSRPERRRLRAMAHRLGKADREGVVDEGEVNRLRGHLAWLHSLNPEQAEKLRPGFLEGKKKA